MTFANYSILFSLILASCLPVSNGENAPSEAVPNEATAPTETPVPSQEDSNEKPPSGFELEFDTDFSRSLISFDEILSGGPKKDGIPAIDEPTFETIEQADGWLESNEPVIQLIIGGEVKAYSLQILMWHELVNDTLGGVPIVVSFCPLCNTAIVFGRSVDNQILDFGTTGRLRYSNLIMYDRQTESWWQQAEGRAIIGELLGTQLEFFPASIISWDEFKNAHPAGLVLSRETGFSRTYGSNPYVGYDDVNNPPFLYNGPETPGQLPAVAHVLAVDINDDPVAYPLDMLSEMHVVNDKVGDQDIVILWKSGTASALDASSIAEGKDVGAAIAYSSLVDGKYLTFKFDGLRFLDDQTGSIWNVLGRATDGDLVGRQLEEIVSVNHLWFSWAVFKPETRVYQP